MPLQAGKTTLVEYQVHANPGGSLPDWLANVASKKLPHDTLIGLRRQVKFREYPALEAEILGSTEAHSLFGVAAKAALKPAPTPPPTGLPPTGTVAAEPVPAAAGQP